jgi:2-dehydropantoate 2-reductase
VRFAVLGPGGVGGLVASLLAAAGHDVVVLACPSTAAHVAEHGLRLTSDRFGEIRVRPQAAERLAVPVDAAVVTTKATSLVEALDRLPPERVGAAVLLPLLNGHSVDVPVTHRIVEELRGRA